MPFNLCTRGVFEPKSEKFDGDKSVSRIIRATTREDKRLSTSGSTLAVSPGDTGSSSLISRGTFISCRGERRNLSDTTAFFPQTCTELKGKCYFLLT